MTLLELVLFFRSGGSFEMFCHIHDLKSGAEKVDIYLEYPFGMDNNLLFVQIERNNDKSTFYHKNTCIKLFNFRYFLNAMDEANDRDSKFLSDETVAKLLYASKDTFGYQETGKFQRKFAKVWQLFLNIFPFKSYQNSNIL